ncbi:MAG: primosomal protein N' [Desulfobacterales bacterium]|nr:primosomal protein N' [Desulfobacterales bacterium]MBF0397315.1 primosomal protein N' [Desulfobacterales bacterium]
MTEIKSYIEVAVPVPIHKTFTYLANEFFSPFISIGKRVLVPFGKLRLTGYVLGESNNISNIEIKQIFDVLDEKPLFPLSMVPFFKWIADYYLYPIGEVLKTALPQGLNIYESMNISITEHGKHAIDSSKLKPLELKILNLIKDKSFSKKDLLKKLINYVPNTLLYSMEEKQIVILKKELKGGKTKEKVEEYVKLVKFDNNKKTKLIEFLKERSHLPLKELRKAFKNSSTQIKSLAQEGYIEIYEKKIYRDPFGEEIYPDTPPPNTNEQEEVIASIKSNIGKGFFTYLLAGVTGSGKTEVYLKLTSEVINLGYTVLVLVPEIALISQIEKRFRSRFGECVAVLHSGLSSGERYDQWIRIIDNKTPIVIGARSAIFAPLKNIGLIIVDEEHDSSYKQENNLRYNARDIAVLRAKFDKCIAILGSATPSIQSYYNVKNNKFIELNLKNRIKERPLPKVEIIDLRKYKDFQGIKRFFTNELCLAMAKTLERKEQILIFLNRRGYANLPICSVCGETLKCKNCDISLTFHKGQNAYKCHYCGFFIKAPVNCPKCTFQKVKHFGFGTEKIEKYINIIFPDAKTARMDRDTTEEKDSIVEILKKVKNHEIDILIGTQMVAKGHDFPKITLVGIICADISLNFPDFRAGERTFQLLTQVAGRAGRGEAPGQVFLQTFTPEQFSIQIAKEQDFIEFYNREIVFRRDLMYPPFSRMIQINIYGKDKEKTEEFVKTMGILCCALRQKINEIRVLGPVESPIFKIANQYRWHILLKSTSSISLHKFIYELLIKNSSKINKRGINVVVDVDPMNMM